ncbi:MAG: KH domain-containing protein [bacterium]|nr:KH domain-containing protein [bacterium]
MEEEKLKIIEEEIKKLLELLELTVTVKNEVDEEGAVHLSLETEEAGLLIGYHGQNLVSLQLILNLIVYKKLGTWVKILLNVGDWRQKREEYLRGLALKIAQRVEETGEEVVCPYLSPSERREVHLILGDNPRVITESEGEGESRRLVIKPKS